MITSNIINSPEQLKKEILKAFLKFGTLEIKEAGINQSYSAMYGCLFSRHVSEKVASDEAMKTHVEYMEKTLEKIEKESYVYDKVQAKNLVEQARHIFNIYKNLNTSDEKSKLTIK